MSLIQLGPTTPPPDRVPEPTKPAQLRPVVVDNQFTSVDALMGFVEGMPISVNYYKQINDNVSGTYGYDPEKTQLLQQYLKINGLELRLDGDLDHSQDQKTQTFTIKGNAYVTNGVVPNEGDLFCYESGGGRFSIFQINQTTRRKAMNNSVYFVSFQMMFYTSDKRFADLESKVRETQVYIKDNAQFGAGAVVSTTTFEHLKALHKLQTEMAGDFIREFTDNEHRFLAVPFQSEGKTYDPFASEAFRRMLDPYRRGDAQIDQVRFYKFTMDEYRSQYTLWDVLIERRKEMLIGCRNLSETTGLGSQARYPMLRSIRYCGASRLVIPGSDTEVDSRWKNVTAKWIPDEGPAPKGPVHLMTASEAPAVSSVLPNLHPVSHDGYYVLSKAFYNYDPAGFSLLEKLVWDYLNNAPVRIDHVRHLASNYRAWTPVRRFYYTPIILLLIANCMQNAGPATYGDS